ncbi:MAG TPA: hypothetical protein DGG95_12200, partial [Cytophagales bacterium]|nr:hypothetical protein [Cytophagales bacterium]
MVKDYVNIIRTLFLLSTFLLFGAIGFAQTVCDPSTNGGVCPAPAGITCNFAANVEKGCHCFDGIDNDGDGTIDAFDADCAYYYGLSISSTGSGSCPALPPPDPNTVFQGIANAATSSQNTADTPAKISVGDMNGDGVPDAVVTSKWNSTVQVVATANASGFTPGNIMGDYTAPGSKIWQNNGGKAGSNYVFEHETAIADIDGDKIGELFVISSERGGSPNNPPVRFWLNGFKYASAKRNLIPLWTTGGKQAAIPPRPDRPG